MKKRSILSLVLCLAMLLSTVAVKAEEAEYSVLNSEVVRLLGRGEVTETGSRTFNWAAAGFEFEFTGKKAEVLVDKLINSGDADYNGSFFNMAVYNGDELVRRERIRLTEGWNTIYTEAEGDPETKKIMFIRSSEPWMGTASISKLKTDELPKATEEKARLIEFIGDSITAGYANAEELSENPGYCAENTDNWKSYAGIVARNFNADYNVIAYSGKGVYANRSMSSIEGNMTEEFGYEEVLHGSTSLNMSTKKLHNFAEYQPQVVFILLGENDNAAPVPEDIFKTAYDNLLNKVRDSYPDATVICASMSMNIKYVRYFDIIKELVEAPERGEANKFHMVVFDEYRSVNEWHPDGAEHERMAKKVIEKIDSIENVWDSPRTNSIVKVTLNGEGVAFDVQPKIVNNSTMVPLRAIAESLGFSVLWNEEDKSIMMTKGEKIVVMQIDNNKLFINDEAKELVTAPMIDSGRTLVPLRAVAESFDMEVDWNGEEMLVALKDAE